MRKSDVLVCGLGYKGNMYPSKRDKSRVKEYTLWADMLSRCTEKCWVKQPAYNGVTCSENFKSYSFFYEWCQSQVGAKNIDENGKAWRLDKDILIKGNKLYSEDTCCFVPLKINAVLLKCTALRGKFPIGVAWHTKDQKFRVFCNIGLTRRKFLGNFNTTDEAFLAYKTAKEAYIKQLANEYKCQLDLRVYDALMSYQVEITD